MTDSAIVALVSAENGLNLLEKFGSYGWMPMVAFFVFIFRRELQDWMRMRVRMLGKKNRVPSNGGDVSGDTDTIKRINGHDPVVLQSNCHEAMGKMEVLIGGIETKIDAGFSNINDKLFELARDK
jgi:hypothetical protein